MSLLCLWPCLVIVPPGRLPLPPPMVRWLLGKKAGKHTPHGSTPRGWWLLKAGTNTLWLGQKRHWNIATVQRACFPLQKERCKRTSYNNKAKPPSTTKPPKKQLAPEENHPVANSTAWLETEKGQTLSHTAANSNSWEETQTGKLWILI